MIYSEDQRLALRGGRSRGNEGSSYGKASFEDRSRDTLNQLNVPPKRMTRRHPEELLERQSDDMIRYDMLCYNMIYSTMT